MEVLKENGRFSTKSAHALACGGISNTRLRKWAWLEKVRVHRRVKNFLWLSCHEKLPATHLHHHRGMEVAKAVPLVEIFRKILCVSFESAQQRNLFGKL